MGDIEKLIFKDVVVVVINLCRGTLIEAKQLGALLDEEIASGCKKLIVDLSECEFVDSTFIGTLVLRYKKLKESGGNLRLVLPAVQRDVIFAVTNTLGLFDTFRTRKDAVDSFVFAGKNN